MSANEVVIFTGDSKRVNKVNFYYEHTETQRKFACCRKRVNDTKDVCTPDCTTISGKFLTLHNASVPA